MSDRQIAVEPWHAELEVELKSREGICFITLLTDECGCLLLKEGIVPEYLRRQAESALQWNATEDRGIAERLLQRDQQRKQA